MGLAMLKDFILSVQSSIHYRKKSMLRRIFYTKKQKTRRRNHSSSNSSIRTIFRLFATGTDSTVALVTSNDSSTTLSHRTTLKNKAYGHGHDDGAHPTSSKKYLYHMKILSPSCSVQSKLTLPLVKCESDLADYNQ